MNVYKVQDVASYPVRNGYTRYDITLLAVDPNVAHVTVGTLDKAKANDCLLAKATGRHVCADVIPTEYGPTLGACYLLREQNFDVCRMVPADNGGTASWTICDDPQCSVQGRILLLNHAHYQDTITKHRIHVECYQRLIAELGDRVARALDDGDQTRGRTPRKIDPEQSRSVSVASEPSSTDFNVVNR